MHACHLRAASLQRLSAGARRQLLERARRKGRWLLVVDVDGGLLLHVRCAWRAFRRLRRGRRSFCIHLVNAESSAKSQGSAGVVCSGCTTEGGVESKGNTKDSAAAEVATASAGVLALLLSKNTTTPTPNPPVGNASSTAAAAPASPRVGLPEAATNASLAAAAAAAAAAATDPNAVALASPPPPLLPPPPKRRWCRSPISLVDRLEEGAACSSDFKGDALDARCFSFAPPSLRGFTARAASVALARSVRGRPRRRLRTASPPPPLPVGRGGVDTSAGVNMTDLAEAAKAAAAAAEATEPLAAVTGELAAAPVASRAPNASTGVTSASVASSTSIGTDAIVVRMNATSTLQE